MYFIIAIGFISHTNALEDTSKKLLSNFVAIKINVAYGNGMEGLDKKKCV